MKTYKRARYFIRYYRHLMRTWDIHAFEAARCAWWSAKQMEFN